MKSMANVLELIERIQKKSVGFGAGSAEVLGVLDSIKIQKTGKYGEVGYTEEGVCDVHGAYLIARHEAGRGMLRYSPTGVCPQCQRVAKIRRESGGSADSFGARFSECTIKSYETSGHEGKIFARDKSLEYVKGFLAGERKCLIFAGNTGNGKNHLASAICKALDKNGYSTLKIKATEYINLYFGEDWKHKNDTIKRFEQLDLLVIDEIDKFQSTAATQSALFDLFDARYVAGKATMVLTNFNKDSLKAHIGEFSFDRLKPATLVPFFWESYR